MPSTINQHSAEASLHEKIDALHAKLDALAAAVKKITEPFVLPETALHDTTEAK